MKNLRNAWNMAESAMESPVLNNELMSQIAGGKQKPGSGYIRTISGECNTSGKSCSGSLQTVVEGIIDAIFG